MHIRCLTEHAILLLGVFDDKQVMRFPDEGKTHGGLLLNVDINLPIDPQLLDRAKAHVDTDFDARHVTIYQEFDEVIDLPDTGSATVYLGQVASEGLTAGNDWASFPELIRRLPKDRSRLPYLKAWQVLTGGLKLDTRAIENADLGKLFSE